MKRFAVALLSGALAITFGCGAVLSFGHWTPAGLIALETYNQALTQHAVPLLLLFPATLLLLAELEDAGTSRPPWLARGAWAALGVAAGALALRLAADEGVALHQWTGMALFPPCALVTAVVLLRLREPLRARQLALSFASLIQLVGLGLGLPLSLASVDLGDYPRLSSLGQACSGAMLEATALATVVVAVDDGRRKRGLWLPFVLLALATIAPRSGLYVLVATPAAALGTLWLLLGALREPQAGRGTGERLFVALAALTFVESVCLGELLSLIGDTHLGDTYFVVGLLHLRVVAGVLAVLAAVLRQRAITSSTRLTYAAAILTGLGSQLMCFAMVMAGTRGMPRRYFHYLPEFQSLHQLIAVGGTLFMLGVGLALARTLVADVSSR